MDFANIRSLLLKRELDRMELPSIYVSPDFRMGFIDGSSITDGEERRPLNINGIRMMKRLRATQ